MQLTVEQKFELQVLRRAIKNATKEELIDIVIEATELMFAQQNAVKETLKEQISRGLF